MCLPRHNHCGYHSHCCCGCCCNAHWMRPYPIYVQPAPIWNGTTNVVTVTTTTTSPSATQTIIDALGRKSKAQA